jgi:hypothetical protein
MDPVLSLDAKLIAATNMAVAEAIWQTYYLQRGGTPAQTAGEMVLKDVKQSVKELERIAKKILDEEADAALDVEKAPIPLNRRNRTLTGEFAVCSVALACRDQKLSVHEEKNDLCPLAIHIDVSARKMRPGNIYARFG